MQTANSELEKQVVKVLRGLESNRFTKEYKEGFEDCLKVICTIFKLNT